MSRDSAKSAAPLAIKCYIRTRPTTDFASDNIKIFDDKQTVTVNIDKSDPLNFLNTPECSYSFKFHSVLHNVSQEIVFEEAVREIVDSFIQGYHGCLFSIGQRGSGKTFTMFGDIRQPKYHGVIPRSIAYVFQELEKFKTIQFVLNVQFFQVYNDLVYDLLSDNDLPPQIAEDENGSPYVQNLSLHHTTTVQSALQLLSDGETKLRVTEHKHGRKAHRSHVIFVFDLVGRKATRMTRSRLIAADLAAVEEAADSAFVNKSISYLQQLVVSIVNKDTRHLPFRRSKLTYLMRDAVGGNCRTTCIANVWPEALNNRETISTLQFASDLGRVQNAARVNTLDPLELRIEKLERERRTLDAERELQGELGGAVRIDGLRQDEEAAVSDVVRRFLADELDEVPLPSLAHVKAAVQEIKRRYVGIPSDAMRDVTKVYSLTERLKSAKGPRDVGSIDGTGFSIGVAASQDRPANTRAAMKTDVHAQPSTARADHPPPPTRDEMFEIYKMRDGNAGATEFMLSKRETRELVERRNATVAEINAAQAELAELREMIERGNLRERTQVFEDEAQLLKGEVAAKAKYRELYANLQGMQARIDALKERSAQLRIGLLAAFQEWYGKWERNELYTQKVVPPGAAMENLQSGKDLGKTKGKLPPPPMKPKPPVRGGRK
jgi:kinesin family protein 6/9